MRIVVSPSPLAAAQMAADAMAELITSALDDRGRAFVAVSGGLTPQPMFERLASRQLPWQDVYLFQVDERAVPAGDVSRNWLHQQVLVERVPTANRHPMPVERPDGDQTYASDLQATLGQLPAFDVVHLGLGDDGHTASLFPDDPALSVFDHDVVWTTEHRGKRRMSLTLPVLARARHQVWLVAGADKAAAVCELTTPPAATSGTTPAAMVAAGAEATLFADEAAAELVR